MPLVLMRSMVLGCPKPPSHAFFPTVLWFSYDPAFLRSCVLAFVVPHLQFAGQPARLQRLSSSPGCINFLLYPLRFGFFLFFAFKACARSTPAFFYFFDLVADFPRGFSRQRLFFKNGAPQAFGFPVLGLTDPGIDACAQVFPVKLALFELLRHQLQTFFKVMSVVGAYPTFLTADLETQHIDFFAGPQNMGLVFM